MAGTFFSLASILLAAAGIRFLFSARRSFEPDSFALKPWLFDKRFIELTGRVTVVLPDRGGEKLKRRFTDWHRSLRKSEDHRNRYIHERVLIRSDDLKPGQSLLVLHNTKYGKLGIRRGQWIRVRGEYLHVQGKRRRGPFRLRTFYGRVHHTHPPGGFCEILPGRPKRAEDGEKGK